MSIEIIPAGASAVVTKSTGDCGCNNGYNGSNNCGCNNGYNNGCCCESRSYSDGEVQVMRDVKDARHDLTADNNDRFIKLNDSVTQAASASSLANSHTVEVLQNGFCQAADVDLSKFMEPLVKSEKFWKDKWFEQREVTGRLGLKEIEQRHKENLNVRKA